MYTFLNNNNIISNLRFEFRQQYSTSHALINISDNKRKALDDGNVGCGVFLDLQKAFDTVDHQTLLANWITVESNCITVGFVEFQTIDLNTPV